MVGSPPEPRFDSNLRLEAAAQLGCEIISHDPETGYLNELRLGEGRRVLLGGLSPLNDASAATLASDKFYTAKILAAAGYRVPLGCRCLAPGVFAGEYESMRGIEPGLRFAEARGFPLIVKPNRGARGRDVCLVHDARGLHAAIEGVWVRDYLALVQVPVAGIDLRVDFLDGDYVFGYLRRPVVVEGDGVRELARLLAAADPRFAEPEQVERLSAEPLWAEVVGGRGWDLRTVLPAGQRLNFATPILNLNRLCFAERVEQLSAPWLAAGLRIGELLSLRHYGVDFKILALDRAPNHAVVLEVNASPSLAHVSRLGFYEDALAVEKRVVRAIFSS